MVKKLTICILLLLLGSCYPFPLIHNKNHFYLRNKKIEISDIKTDGYYYNVYNLNGSYTKNKGTVIRMRVLLKNGYQHYVRSGYGNECGDTITLDCDMKMSEYMLDKYQNSINNDHLRKYGIWNWGKYEIKNDTIVIQFFYNLFGDYFLAEEKGVVIDSNSFRLFMIKDYRSDSVAQIDEFYRFKEYNIENMYKKIPSKLLTPENKKNDD